MMCTYLIWLSSIHYFKLALRIKCASNRFERKLVERQSAKKYCAHDSECISGQRCSSLLLWWCQRNYSCTMSKSVDPGHCTRHPVASPFDSRLAIDFRFRSVFVASKYRMSCAARELRSARSGQRWIWNRSGRQSSIQIDPWARRRWSHQRCPACQQVCAETLRAWSDFEKLWSFRSCVSRGDD